MSSSKQTQLKAFDPLDSSHSEARLAQWLEKADPAQVHAVIQKNGVEECAHLIHQIPSEKLLAVIDLDVWTRTSERLTEGFDSDQFLCWLKALLYAGTEHTIETLVAFGVETCAGLFVQYLEQTPLEIYAMNRAESGLALEDKEIEHGDPLELGMYCGSYVRLLEQRSLDELADVFLEILGGFEEHDPEFLSGVFHYMAAKEDSSTLLDDFKWDRVMRLEQAGYTPSHKAREYLLRFRREKGMAQFSKSDPEGLWKPAEARTLLALLQKNLAHEHAEAVVAEADKERTLSSVLGQWLQETPAATQSNFQQDWAWLANLFAGGWSMNSAPLSPKSALRCVQATVELGLQVWGQSSTEQNPIALFSLVDVFECGWSFLYSGVAVPAARAVDARLKLRAPENTLVREAWFRACNRRKLKEFGMAIWLRQGRYQLIAEVLEELEYVLGAEAVFLARLMLDDMPRVPDQKSHRIPRGKVKQRGLFVSRPQQVSLFHAFLKEALVVDARPRV